MPINDWSESILVLELTDEPAFADDMEAIMRRLSKAPHPLPDVIADMKGVSYINSSNIAQLLRLRKLLHNNDARLRICAVNEPVWAVIMTTGLDKLFEFTDDVSTSLASLQI
jgi:anti-anti-sigma factor